MRPLPTPKLPSPGDNAAGGSAGTSASAATGGTWHAAAAQPLPWRDPGLRFTSAPVVDDDVIVSSGHAESHQREPSTSQNQAGLAAAVSHVLAS